MRESLRQLAALQRLDDALARLEAERDVVLPQRRAAFEAERAAGEAAVAEARGALEARQADHRAAEKGVEDLQSRQRELKTEQGRTKDNAVYRALDKQIESLDTTILEAMYAIDAAASRVPAAREALAAEQKRLEAVARRVTEELARLDGRAGEIEKERERLEGARAELLALLDAELRSRYEKVASRARPALALVSGGICPACQFAIPPQDQVELRAATRIVACGRCRRLLVHANVAAEPA